MILRAAPFFLTWLFFACLICTGSAQFAIGGRYTHIAHGYWHEAFEDANGEYADQATSIYGTYWFRLKEKRVEFLPEVGYYGSINKNVGSGPPNHMRAVYFQFNTDIYFLDFGNDCNCPTFSKQSDVIKRGVFLEVSPGVEMRKLDIDFVEDGQLATRTFKNTVPRVSGGLGLDIGFSDLITVTPHAGITYAFGTTWEGVEEFLDVPPGNITNSRRDNDLIFYGGVRVLLRPDYVSGRRR